jgi:hypothetical protein
LRESNASSPGTGAFQLQLSLVTSSVHFCAMQRSTLWLMLVVLLLGILFLREPRLERSEEFFCAGF